jgi:hypothetical protein
MQNSLTSPKEKQTSTVGHDPPISHYVRRVRGSLRIIPSSDLLGSSFPTSFIYPQSVSCSGLQLSCWGPPLQSLFSTINPVLAYEASPTYPFQSGLFSEILSQSKSMLVYSSLLDSFPSNYKVLF